MEREAHQRPARGALAIALSPSFCSCFVDTGSGGERSPESRQREAHSDARRGNAITRCKPGVGAIFCACFFWTSPRAARRAAAAAPLSRIALSAKTSLSHPLARKINRSTDEHIYHHHGSEPRLRPQPRSRVCERPRHQPRGFRESITRSRRHNTTHQTRPPDAVGTRQYSGICLRMSGLSDVQSFTCPSHCFSFTLHHPPRSFSWRGMRRHWKRPPP